MHFNTFSKIAAFCSATLGMGGANFARADSATTQPTGGSSLVTSESTNEPTEEENPLNFSIFSAIRSEYRGVSGVLLDSEPVIQSDLYISKQTPIGTFHLELFASLPTSTKGFTEVDVNFGFSKSISKDLTVSLNSNNFFFPDSKDNIDSVHEIEGSVAYTGFGFPIRLQLIQDIDGRDYTLTSLSVGKTFELGHGFSFTPNAALSAVLKTGGPFSESGLGALKVGGTLNYQHKQNWPAIFISVDCYKGLGGPEFEDGVRASVGISFSF